MARLFVMVWCKPTILSYFSLTKSLKSLRGFENNIFLFNFPKSITLWFNSHHHEVHWNVWSLRYFLVVLHQTYNQVSLFLHWNSELWVIEPSIIGIVHNCCIFVFFVHFSIDWIWSTCSVSIPFTINWELWPSSWENLAKIHFIEVRTEILIFHPPVTIIFEGVLKFFLQTLMVIPSFIFISEFTSPFTLTPWISDSNQLKTINISNLLNTESMIP